MAKAIELMRIFIAAVERNVFHTNAVPIRDDRDNCNGPPTPTINYAARLHFI